MSRGHAAGWNDQRPLEGAESKAQIRSVLLALGPRPQRVLDLGCGSGRVLVPVARAGHEMVGLDQDNAPLASCRARLQRASLPARLVHHDFLRPWPRMGGRFDAVLCLGHTLMTVTDVNAAGALLRRAAALLRAGGAILIDDFPQQLWPELTSGRWRNGVSADGSLEMSWSPDDNVFTLRRPRAARRQDRERRFRLWTMGQLTLLARGAGLRDPRWSPALAGIIIFEAGSPRYRH